MRLTHISLIFALMFAGFADATYAQQRADSRPNILFIISDDHAYQAISAYGSKLIQTPNIDRIAHEGALFNNVFVTNSLCAPARATLLTGKYSHVNGLEINYGQNFNVQQELFTRILQQNGYQTSWIGKWHLHTLPDGFDSYKILVDQGHYYNPDFISTDKDTARIEGYVTNIITNLTEDFLNHRDTSKPFCLIVGEKAPHREWLPDLPDLGALDSVHFPMPSTFYDDYAGRLAAGAQDMTVAKTMILREDLKVHLDYHGYAEYTRFTPEQQKAFAAYYDKVSKDLDSQALTGDALVKWKYQRYLKDYLSTTLSLDRNVGKILAYLDSTGLSKNTIVVYCSDQGFYMGEHGWFDKRWMYEPSLRTPFMMRYPGVIQPGTKVDPMVVNIDFAPTLLSAAGITPPEDMQGKNFLPLVAKGGGTKGWRKAMYYHYYEFPQPHHVSPHFGVRTERYKLIRFYGPKDYWELYDLKKDPIEMHNVYGQEAYRTITTSLRKQLDQLIDQYKDTEARDILTKAATQ